MRRVEEGAREDDVSEEEFRRAVRHGRKRKRLGPSPYCASCGKADIRTLQRSGGEILCVDCRLVAQGKLPCELHHPAGKQNDAFELELSANDHAIFNDMQIDWPKGTLMNPKRNHILKTAASRRATANLYRWRAELAEKEAVDYEVFDEFCRIEIGEDWIEKFEEFRERRGI
jgi:hypothetical protein